MNVLRSATPIQWGKMFDVSDRPTFPIFVEN